MDEHAITDFVDGKPHVGAGESVQNIDLARGTVIGIVHENRMAALDHYTQLKTVYVELGEVACGYR